MNKKRLLVVTAHPDDESFGPAGTIARYANEGVEVHVVCATRGESGDAGLVDSSKYPFQDKQVASKKDIKLENIREQELLNAAKILGIKRVDFLGFVDGTLDNQQYHLVAEKIIEKIKRFKPQVVLTYEPGGVSGHLDHVAISYITTYAYFKSNIAQKLYYYCLPEKFTKKTKEYLKDYFVYFPDGYRQEDIITRIDVSSVWDKRVEAVKQHKSQMQDVERILAILEIRNLKVEHYILHHSQVKASKKETDLFEGITQISNYK